jgi:hypothetical protein
MPTWSVRLGPTLLGCQPLELASLTDPAPLDEMRRVQTLATKQRAELAALARVGLVEHREPERMGPQWQTASRPALNRGRARERRSRRPLQTSANGEARWTRSRPHAVAIALGDIARRQRSATLVPHAKVRRVEGPEVAPLEACSRPFCRARGCLRRPDHGRQQQPCRRRSRAGHAGRRGG